MAPRDTNDLSSALALAVRAMIFGSFAGGAANRHALLLLSGIAGAFLVRWRLYSPSDRRWMTACTGLCAAASMVMLAEAARLVQASATPHRGVFVASAAALMATVIAAVLRESPSPSPSPEIHHVARPPGHSFVSADETTGHHARPVAGRV